MRDAKLREMRPRFFAYARELPLATTENVRTSKKPHVVMVAIMPDIRAIRTIRTIRVLMLLILNKIYNANFTNATNTTNLTLTELWGDL